jgi:hypothetical protein
MNREDIIRMAQEAGFFIKQNEIYSMSTQSDQELTEWIERFAALVAKHTLANIDPSSFMTWQEGYEVGKQTEREACAKLCDDLDDDIVDGLAGWQYAEAIRTLGQA